MYGKPCSLRRGGRVIKHHKFICLGFPPLHSSIAAEPVFCVAGPVLYEYIRVFLIALRALFKYGLECFWEVGVQSGGGIVVSQ